MLYLAIERPKDERALEALSTRMMRWKDDIWLVDLAATRSYWEAAARRRGLPLGDLWRSLVMGLLGEGGSAALARHPFQALLLARHLSTKKLPGFAQASEPLTQVLWKDLTWATQWQVTEELLPHLTQLKDPRGHPATFRQKLGLMQRSMRRLGLKLPWQLEGVDPLQVRRRFGALFGDLWDWCYGEAGPCHSQASEASRWESRASDFPWSSFRFASDPSVSRALDYGINDWQAIEPWLREDLDKLCDLPQLGAKERIVELSWRLVFDDLSEKVLSVRFRHPHALQKERGTQTTALKQCLYAYEAMPRDETIIPPPLVAWQLTVTERMTPTAVGLTLFGEGDGQDDTLLALENRLKLALTRHAVCEDWLPEDSQMTASGGDSWPSLPPRTESMPSLGALARARPLFLYEQPQPFDPKAKELRFLERTMSKWWRTGHEPGRRTTRDYFRATGAQEKDFWVFRDGQGRWFVHGVFA